MSGLFTILIICMSIMFVSQSLFNTFLFLGVALIYTWFFKPTWKYNLKKWVSFPFTKVKNLKYDFQENKRKKEVDKIFKNMKR